ncbi:MAG: ABC transporter substrate-binding protein, partial [Egibacteraceae bacterium]
MSTALLDAPVITDATRRQLLAGAAAALLAGCGASDRGGDVPDDTGGFPVTIDGAFGPTRIERRPARVAAVGFLRDGDDALALGITPVLMGVSGNFPEGLAPWTRAALGSATPPTVDVSEDLPLEQVAAARPDLILATDDRTLADHHDRLTGIAPVLAYTVGAEAEPWRLRAERIGRALGRSQRAGEVVRGIQD